MATRLNSHSDQYGYHDGKKELIVEEGDEVVIKIRRFHGTRSLTEEIGSITEDGKWRRKRKPKEKKNATTRFVNIYCNCNCRTNSFRDYFLSY